MKTTSPFLYALTLLTMTVHSSCHSPSETSVPQPAAVITKKMDLVGIPSASGIEKVGDRYYVIGDDSPYLFCLNERYEIIQKVALLASPSLTQGRIPKPLKPDFEAITALEIEDNPYLLILGSGSTDKRNMAYLVPISSKGAGAPTAIPLEKLYQSLREDPTVVGTAALNIEGVAADEEFLYLFHRFAPGGQNTLITYSLEALTPFLQGRAPAPKPRKIQAWALPELEKIKTGFSGAASTAGGKLLFTASAEETPNAVLDGEVYGSLMGWLPVSQTSATGQPKPDVLVPISDAAGLPYKGKIESISVMKHPSDRSLVAVAVADNDNGTSELVELQFSW